MAKDILKNILTPRDKAFADKVIGGMKKTQAAREVFPEITSSPAKGSQVLNKQVVRDYIESQAYGAATRITKMSCLSRNEMVKLAANKDILDRAGYKPQEAAVNINIPLYLPPELLEKYNLKQSTTEDNIRIKADETNQLPEGNNTK